MCLFLISQCTMLDVRHLFQACFQIAVNAAMPEGALADVLPSKPKGRTIVVGAGKGATQLASCFEKLYPYPIEGLIVTRYGFGIPCTRLDSIEAAHPVPDKNSAIAAKRLLEIVAGLREEDLVVALMTGGGSALLAAPLAPMTLQDEILLNQKLLGSAVPIGAMNTLRRHLSAIKGGRLAAAAQPAAVITYVISDVPGDDPSEVASGPTVAGRTVPADARQIIENYRLELPHRVLEVLQLPQAECPNVKHEVHILASAAKSLEAIECFAQQEGFALINLGDDIEGEAKDVAKAHADFVRSKQCEGFRGLIISGGETTVTLRGSGRGGRNSEYLLALAIELTDLDDVAMFAADTDGVDGSEDNAGAFADVHTVARLASVGIDASKYLENNNSYAAFEALHDLYIPGPTGTNVNDLRLIWIGEHTAA